MNNEEYSMSCLKDSLYEVIHNSDIPAETIIETVRDTLQESETYLESRLDRCRDVLRYFSDGSLTTEEFKETAGDLDFTDGYEWTPLTLDHLNKSKHYWNPNRNK